MQAVADSAQQQAQRTALAEQQLAVMREELATVGQRQVPPPPPCRRCRQQAETAPS